jgi:hypothetical protein
MEKAGSIGSQSVNGNETLHQWKLAPGPKPHPDKFYIKRIKIFKYGSDNF